MDKQNYQKELDAIRSSRTKAKTFQKAKKPYFKPFSSIFEKKNQYKIIKVLNNL